MNKEQKRIYMKEYYQKNKDKIREQRKNKRNEDIERYRERARKYYHQNKEKVYKAQRQWATKNEKHFSKLCQESRRRRVEKLRTEGVINAWRVVVSGKEPKYKEV